MYCRHIILAQFFLIVQHLFSFTKCDERASRVRRIVGGVEANYPPYDDPTVYVRFNGRSARVEGLREFPHYVFKGIKYAHAPTGADRFLRPREKFLEGDIKATLFAPPCIQPVPGRNMILGSEDCLALNIFTPDLPTGTEGLPVIVWIHGGGFRYGSASQYGVRHLVGQRLVVVTIQYRLGSLGFLSSGNKQLPGNAALWDMALAVQWVRNYIGFFGGNPHRIVVMGHDTGASSALLLTLSKIAKGVPSAVVAMSGTAVSRWAIDNTPSNTAKEIADQNGCPTADVVTMVKCLQRVPAESIIKGDSNIEFEKLQSRGFMSGLTGRLGTAPVAEGRNDRRSLPGLVEVDPVEALYKQDNPRIPLLTGVTKDETKKAVTGNFKDDIVKQLTTIPNFLDKVLVKGLQKNIVIDNLTGGKLTTMENLNGTISGTGQIISGQNGLESLGNILPLNFRNYLQAKTNDIRGGLNKISEVTADALFNVPAFLTAQLWKDAPTFLYSFEHSGKMKRGFTFLQGVPLVGNSSFADTDNNTVSHGDELAYLFEAHDLEGNPLASDTPTDVDLNVRNVFTRMIADFARHGEISIGNKKVPYFSGKDNNFIQIKPEPALANKFRFCEMALWTNIGERLKNNYCQFLRAFDVAGLSKTLMGGSKGVGNVGSIVEGLGFGKGRDNGRGGQQPLQGVLGNVQQAEAVGGSSQKSFKPLGGIIGK